MEIAFSMYDFDNDYLISANDVQLLLSYIPFRTQESVKNFIKEGKIIRNTDLTYEIRDQQQNEIQNFVDLVFKEKK